MAAPELPKPLPRHRWGRWIIAGNAIQVSGSIPITFAEWNIPNPSFGPVTTEDHGALEFLLNLSHA